MQSGPPLASMPTAWRSPRPSRWPGTCSGAAAALAAVTCVLAIRDGIVPPTINLDDPDPDCDLDYVAPHRPPLPVRAAIANGFGFGGQNASVLFARP